MKLSGSIYDISMTTEDIKNMGLINFVYMTDRESNIVNFKTALQNLFFKQ